MHHCSVFGCKNAGNHSFPKDKNVRKLWEATICKNFVAKKHSKICSAHFKSEDFIKVGRFSGLYNTRNILKKGIVPSIFQWTKTEDIKFKQKREQVETHEAKLNFAFIERSEYMKNLDLVPVPNVTTAIRNTSSEKVALDYGVDHVKEAAIVKKYVNNSQLKNNIADSSDRATQKKYQLYTTESFRNDDTGINFYTGFESFNKFMFVFNTLCPEVYSLTYKRSQVMSLSVEDQFFITLMKLRRNTEDYELGRFFNISPCTVWHIFFTWINFMHQMWSMLNTWPNRELVDFYTSEGFKKDYPSTRVTVDCPEIPIQQPKKPAMQRLAWNSYKNHSTVNFEVGASPSGLISHCSNAYAESTSDRQITEKSQLYQKCEKGHCADRGLNVPSFLKGKCQLLPGMTVVTDQKLSRKRIHIEHLIGLTKTYKILQNPVHSDYVPLMSKIHFICVMMCNFRENIKSTV